ncbi:MAG: KEOPS complex subunit Cgi121 [Promethearchaeota archaeon]
MIIKEFKISDLNLKYFIGINQISVDFSKLLDQNKLENRDQVLEFIFDVIEKVQRTYKGATIQFFSQEYVLDQDHIFNASYFMEKAFRNGINISNKKNIELLLYLATNRQIKIGIEAFGVKFVDVKKGGVLYCIISQENNIDEINNEIIRILQANELPLNLNKRSYDKFKSIKDYFAINEHQIITVLKSYGISNKNEDLMSYKLEDLYLALNDLICEKMTLLSLEKIKLD